MKLTLSIAASACLAISSLQAQSFITPDFRGDTDTVYSAWDVFTSADGANSPDVEGTIGTITELTGAAFITGGGNLYNAAFGSQLLLGASLSNEAGTVLFQTYTLGTEISYAGVTLNYFDPIDGATSLSAATTTELERVALGGFGGEAVSTAFSWDLSDLGVSDFTITFSAPAAHLSLDQASLDVSSVSLAVIPEPSAIGLLAGIFAFAFCMRRRR